MQPFNVSGLFLCASGRMPFYEMFERKPMPTVSTVTTNDGLVEYEVRLDVRGYRHVYRLLPEKDYLPLSLTIIGSDNKVATMWYLATFDTVLAELTNDQRWWPIRVVSTRSDGGTNVLDMRNIRINAKVDPSLFTFNIPAGAQVFDNINDRTSL